LGQFTQFSGKAPTVTENQ